MEEIGRLRTLHGLLWEMSCNGGELLFIKKIMFSVHVNVFDLSRTSYTKNDAYVSDGMAVMVNFSTCMCGFNITKSRSCVWLFGCLTVCLSDCVSGCLAVSLPVWLCLFLCLWVSCCLPVFAVSLVVCLSVCLSVCLAMCCMGFSLIYVAPDAPKSLQARPELGARGIRVTFTPPLPKLGGGITRYELTYVSLEPGHQFVPITHSISRFSSRRATVRLRVLGLQRLTKYLFTVRAVNSYGRGQPATIEGTTEGNS